MASTPVYKLYLFLDRKLRGTLVYPLLPGCYWQACTSEAINLVVDIYDNYLTNLEVHESPGEVHPGQKPHLHYISNFIT